MKVPTSNQVNNKVSPEWDVAEARRMVLDKLAPYPVSVFLFGSRANGTMSDNSDIDIAILPKGKLPVGLLSELREALEESQILYSVDLVDLSASSADFKAKVLKGSIVWKD